jgi:type I restriction enzyme S subunit
VRVEEGIAPYAVQANLLVPLGDVCKTTSGGTPSRKNPDYFSGPIPWVKSGELPDGPVVEIEESISEVALRQSSAKLFPAGTLLMALYGATVGKLGILTRPAATNQAVCAIFPPSDLDTKFLFWFLRYKRSELIAQAVGGAQPNISQGIVRDLKIPLLPLDQQKHIVAEIEKQFSRLDEADANLKRVKANLKRYKAAVLKAAVEGRLVETEAERARREGRIYETGAQLLQRILETRRSQWNGKGKYKEPAAPDTTDLPELPEGWVWASVQQLAEVRLGKMLDKQKHKTGNELPYLRNINVRWGSVETDDLLTMYFEDDEFDRYGLRCGDVLVCEGGEPGRAAVWDGRFPTMKYQKALHRVRFVPGYDGRLLVAYLEYLAKSGRLEHWFTGSTIKHFTGESFASLPIPLSPIAEQGLIIEEVERLLSLADDADAQVNANVQRAERLRQSILSNAFAGNM